MTEAASVSRLTKHYGGTTALDGASFAIEVGEIHALLGENGAGKSTMVKLLSGLARPDSGTVSVFGRSVNVAGPRHAHALGLQSAFQEMTLVGDLTVIQNMLLSDEPTGPFGQLNHVQARRVVETALDHLGLHNIDPKAEIRDLPLPTRQKIEIAKAIFRRPRILLLDEPTSALSGKDLDWLFDQMRRLKGDGITIVFISHRLREVRRICDRLTILRNGRDVGTFGVAQVTDEEVVHLIIGRLLESAFPPKPERKLGPTHAMLAARALSTAEGLSRASFSLRRGEILGVAGLQGMGQLQLFLALFGMERVVAGHVEVEGRRVTITSPADAIDARIGISLVPEDRKNEGLFLSLSGRQNVSLPAIDRFCRFGVIDGQREALAVERVLQALSVHPRALYKPCSSFSGGNQQKIVIAKWVLAESRIWLMFDPTRGVDVGTKYEIYVLMHRFARSGGAVLFYSSDVIELVNVCDRILVMYDGRIVNELTGDDVTEEDIMQAALGERAPVPAPASEVCQPAAMSLPTYLGAAQTSRWNARLTRDRGLLIAVVACIAIFLLNDLISVRGMGYVDLTNIITNTMPLILAALGQTLVIVTGGFDLSAGAVVSLVNVVLASHMQESAASELLWTAIGIAIGGLVGFVNGLFIALMRLQSIVVTLALMFVVQGATLMVMETPGGQIPASFSMIATGDLIPGIVPIPLLLLALALLIWGGLKNSKFGTAVYAVGSDSLAAAANGVSVRPTILIAYVVAGCFYGASGVFVSAQISSGDPLVGDAMMLQMFAAVVLGGTTLGGGRGTCLGTVFGALILMMTVNTLVVLNASTYYGTIVEGVILLLAVVGNTVSRGSSLDRHLDRIQRRWHGWRTRTLPSMLPRVRSAPSIVDPAALMRTDSELTGSRLRNFLIRNGATVRLVAPSYIFFLVIVAVTAITFGATAVLNVHYVSTLLVLSGLLAVLGLGQGAVILTGGIDISTPWAITFCGIMFANLVHGTDQAALWALPLVLVVGVLIGLFNGIGVVVLGMPPIVTTLATNGILQGMALVYANGRPAGWVSPSLEWLMTGRILGLAPFVVFVALFLVTSVVLLSHTAFGRRIYAIGNSLRVARLSGVNTSVVTIGAYCLCGLCGALVGVFLAALSGQAFLAMGDPYLLPSIAVVLVGGTLATGGRGHYIGIFGGCLLLTAVGTLLAGTTVSFALRDVVFGCVVLGTVLSLRDTAYA